MWKVVFLAWRLLPRHQKRRFLRAAGVTAKRHGPTVARAAGRAYRASRRRP